MKELFVYDCFFKRYGFCYAADNNKFNHIAKKTNDKVIQTATLVKKGSSKVGSFFKGIYNKIKQKAKDLTKN